MRRLADFIGAFDVSRTIEDRQSGGQTRFEGHAVIAPTASGLADQGATYVETGILMMGDQHFEAERRYGWSQVAARIQVCFADGAPFHDFDPEAGGKATEHLCGEDMYRGGYAFADWPHWSVTWEVSGSRKDYTSRTVYIPR